MSGRNPSQPLLILVIAVVFVGSLLMLFVKQPEQVIAVSPEGRLTVEGLARDASAMKIEALDASSYHYALSIDNGRPIEDVTISFSAKDLPSHSASLLLFDRALNRWTEQLFSYEEQGERFYLDLEQMGSTELRIVLPESPASVDNEDLLY
jgi:hypothetical protein